MIYKLPVRLEVGQTFTSLSPKNLSFPKTSGYDSDNLRVTNIAGTQNGDFLKECPKCGRTKKAVNSARLGSTYIAITRARTRGKAARTRASAQ